MPEKPVRDMVLCYIVHEAELLVFRHVDFSFDEIGIQVPGGGIQPGETPEVASLREATEETGLTDLVLVDKLGETKYDIPPVRYEIQCRHVFHLRPAGQPPRR